MTPRRPQRAPRSSRLLPLLLTLVCVAPGAAWEPTGQRLVTARAVDALPFALQGFFRAHRRRIVALASDPSQWDGADRKQLHHGYLHLDAYGEYPFTALPRNYEAAVRKHSERRLTSQGTLPWQINRSCERLQEAFRVGNVEAIMRQAAILAHYVAEAHDPFNTTLNFDGSRSRQPGVDARYARSLVERYQMFFIIRPSGAFKIETPTEYAFTMLLEAHTWVDNILLADSRARAEQPTYNDAYYDSFYDQIGAVLIRQLSQASQNIGSYWYTAWLNAGSPALPR
ncbi:MAG: hypothetical protein ACE5H2_06910 [Terriglobia bacterium]